MHDVITIVGNVATDPTLGRTGAGVPVTNFRVATSHGRFDEATQSWIEGNTNWYSVAAFRQLGEHAKASLRCGDSVIVTGRLKIRTWEANGKSGTSVDLDADAIGHDLRRGTSAYLRTPRNTTEETPENRRAADDAPELPESAGPATAAIPAEWDIEAMGAGDPVGLGL